MSYRIPIIVCGKSTKVLQGVINFAKPELEVIHGILSEESAVTEIPLILKGKRPSQSSVVANPGTSNYSELPKAIVFGGGYDEASVKRVKEACSDAGKVFWLKADISKANVTPGGPDYPEDVMKRLKEKLMKLQNEGNASAEGLVSF